jgi:hypothetical protein
MRTARVDQAIDADANGFDNALVGTNGMILAENILGGLYHLYWRAS